MPKTYRQLWPQFCTFENLWYAYFAARRGKRARPAVAAYDLDADTRILRLQEQLEAGTWTPGAYRTFVIREWKRRVVSAAPFEDRIVHHALCQVIEPIWEARFIHDSYACRVGKGTHAALNRAQHFARAHRYVLSLDIRQFFPSIDHAVLRDTLQRHLADARLLALCDQIIASGRDILAEASGGAQAPPAAVLHTSATVARLRGSRRTRRPAGPVAPATVRRGGTYAGVGKIDQGAHDG